MREVEVRPFDNIILKDQTFINGNTCMLIIISLGDEIDIIIYKIWHVNLLSFIPFSYPLLGIMVTFIFTLI